MTKPLSHLKRAPYPAKGDETFCLFTLCFNVTEALKLCKDKTVENHIDPSLINRTFVSVNVTHAMSDRCDNSLPGIAVTLPDGLGGTLIDGNHRAYKSMQQGKKEYPVFLLNEQESYSVCYTRDVWDSLEKKKTITKKTGKNAKK